MNPIELDRAAELAQANHEANQLFWTLMIGAVLIFAFWSWVRWRLRRWEQRRRAEGIAYEIDWEESRKERYWDDFARRHDLPESTRNVLKATAVKK